MSLFHGIIILLICTLFSAESAYQCTNGIFKCVSPNSLRICLTGQLVSSEVFCPTGFFCSEISPTICTNKTDFNNAEKIEISDIPKCKSEGKISIPNTCQSYIICTKIQNGYLALVKYCAAGSFNPLSGKCEQNYICPKNNTPISTEQPKIPNVMSEIITQNAECTKQGLFAVPNTGCKKFKFCFLSTDGFEEEINECPYSSLFDPTLQRCSTLYICTENTTTITTTTEVTSVDNTTTPVVVIPTCTTPGTFPLLNTGCTMYTVCLVSSHEYLQRINTCPVGTLFDPINFICSKNYKCLETAINNNPACTIGEITVMLNTNCTKYIRCVVTSNGLFQEVVSCPVNTRFDPVLKKCSANHICSEISIITQRTLDVSKKITRNANYVDECKERGMFPVPNTNCKEYMKCLVTTHGFSKLMVTCPTGTYFDPSVKKCSATYICTESTTVITTTPEQVTTSTITTTVTPITTINTIPPNVTKPSSTQCEKQGSFAIPNTKCKLFKQCFLTTHGFEERNLECPEGLLFDPDAHRCSKTYLCSQTTESTSTTQTPTETTTKMIEEVKCTKPGKIPIPGTYCRKYILCVRTILGLREKEYECPKNTFFNPETQRCATNYQCTEVEITTPSIDDVSKKCTAVGKIPLLGEDCKKYILCSKTINGLKGKVYECPKGYFFEPENSRCSKFYQCKENMPSTTPIPVTTTTSTISTTTEEDISKKCTHAGKIPVLGENCTKYILCALTSTGYKGKIYECPKNSYFDPNRARCFTTYKCQENIPTTTTSEMTSSEVTNESITTSKAPNENITTSTEQSTESITTTPGHASEDTSTSQKVSESTASTSPTTLTSDPSNEDITTITSNKETTISNVELTTLSEQLNQSNTTTSEVVNEKTTTSSEQPDISTSEQPNQSITTTSEQPNQSTTITTSEQPNQSTTTSEQSSTTSEVSNETIPATSEQTNNDIISTSVAPNEETTSSNQSTEGTATTSEITSQKTTTATTTLTTEEVISKKCSSAGKIPVLGENCNKYILCVLSSTGFKGKIYECPNNTYFDPNSARCSTIYKCQENIPTTTTSEMTSSEVTNESIATSETPNENITTSTEQSNEGITTPGHASEDTSTSQKVSKNTASTSPTTLTSDPSNEDITTITSNKETTIPNVELTTLWEQPNQSNTTTSEVANEKTTTSSEQPNMSTSEQPNQSITTDEVPNESITSTSEQANNDNTSTSVTPNEEITSSSEGITTTSEQPNQTITTTSEISNEKTTTRTSTRTTEEDISEKCTSAGKIPVLGENCTKYILCTLTSTGLKGKVYECPKGYFFEPEKSRCSKLYQCKENIPNTTPISVTTTTTISTTTSEQPSQSITTDEVPNGSITSTSEQANNDNTSTSVTPNEEITSSNEGITTTSEQPNQTITTTSEISNEKTTTRTSTRTTEEDISEKCTSAGKVPVLGANCTKYILCVLTSTGFKGKVYECPNGYFFEPEKSRCSKLYQCKENIPSTTPIPVTTTTVSTTTEEDISKMCSYAGKIPVLGENCTKYILCALTSTGIKGKIYECPNNTYFDPSRARCSTTYKCPENIPTTTTSEMTSSEVTNESITTSKAPNENITTSTEQQNEGITTTSDQTNEGITSTSTATNEEITSSEKPIEGITSTSEPPIDGVTSTSVTNNEGTRTTEITERTTTTSELPSTDVTSTSEISNDGITTTEVTTTIIPPCVADGRMLVPGTNCKKYVLCTITKNGFVSTEYTCPTNSYYKPSMNRCSTNYTCEEDIKYCETIGKYPDENDSTCQFYYNCTEQNNYVLGRRSKCEQNQLFNPVLQQCSDTYVCNQQSRLLRKPKANTRFLVNGQCTTVGRYEMQLSNCKNYTLCTANADGTLKGAQLTCPTTSVFNQAIQKCVSPTSYTCPDSLCTNNAGGLWWPNPNIKGCTTYIMCEPVTDTLGNILGNKGVVTYCPTGTKFNPNLQVCDQFYTCTN